MLIGSSYYQKMLLTDPLSLFYFINLYKIYIILHYITKYYNKLFMHLLKTYFEFKINL